MITDLMYLKTYFKSIRGRLLMVSPLFLVISILLTPFSYAAETKVASALGIDSGVEATEVRDETTSNDEPAPTPKPAPVIVGESTNNAQIETTPTPEKDNDIRQRISGIFSEIDGLQAVEIDVTHCRASQDRLY